MKIPFYISVGASALCLILSIVVFAVGLSNQTLQDEVQKQQQAFQAQQAEIDNAGRISQTFEQGVLKDMANASLKNEKMKALLSKYGYNVQVAPGNTPAPK